jgi:glyoxylase-like metal-dependent hydrolase (beta-lactamase superfamily II)
LQGNAPLAAQPAKQDSITLGEIRLTYLPDGEAHFVPTALLPASTEEAWRLHRGLLDEDGRLVTALGGFLIETGDRKVVVDLGLGDISAEFPHFATMAGGRLLDSLRRTGVSPEDVDTVVFTHLHMDHTGWTSRDGVLTFPNARHVTSEAEWAHWQRDETGTGPDAETVVGPLSTRIEHAGGGDAIAPGVNLMSTPGHTPGHCSVVLSSGSARAVILGDVMVCPAQIANAEWGVIFDVDPAMARRTREQLLAELEGVETTVANGHFSGTVFGRVLPGEAARRWVAG